MTLASVLHRLSPLNSASGDTRRRQPSAAAASAYAPEFRTLHHNAVFPLPNKRLQLQVLRGCIWITRDGCAADVLLEVGDTFEQQPGERVLVQALAPSELKLAAGGTGTQNP